MLVSPVGFLRNFSNNESKTFYVRKCLNIAIVFAQPYYLFIIYSELVS